MSHRSCVNWKDMHESELPVFTRETHSELCAILERGLDDIENGRMQKLFDCMPKAQPLPVANSQ